MFQVLRYVFATFLVTTLATFTMAEEPTDQQTEESIDKQSMTDLVVQLRDDEGQPVKGAAVMVYAMRMEENRGHGFWNSEKLGPPVSVISDEQGRAIVRYPAKVGSVTKTLTTSLVTFNISHFDYVQKTVHHDLGPQDLDVQQADVTLKKGCEIQLSAVDSNNQPIEQFGILVAGRSDPAYWVDDPETGGRRTGAASDGTWQTLLVKPQPDGVTLFSSLTPLRVRPNQAVRIRNLKLKPGTRVEGRLSDDVPRPVKNGFVITSTAPKPAGESWSEEDPSVTWMQWEPVNEDGTFVVQSIPRSGKTQIIAVCDGWVSTTVPKHRAFVKGQLFDIDADTIQPVIEMEQTGTLEIMITDPDGEPLDGGTVSSWPNQQYYLGGSNLLGSRYNTITQIENQMRPMDQKKTTDYRTRSKMPFSEQPVENGTVTLRGLPIGMSDSIILFHDDYVLAPKAGKGDADNATLQFNLDSAKPLTIEVTTQKK